MNASGRSQFLTGVSSRSLQRPQTENDRLSNCMTCSCPPDDDSVRRRRRPQAIPLTASGCEPKDSKVRKTAATEDSTLSFRVRVKLLYRIVSYDFERDVLYFIGDAGRA